MTSNKVVVNNNNKIMVTERGIGDKTMVIPITDRVTAIEETPVEIDMTITEVNKITIGITGLDNQIVRAMIGVDHHHRVMTTERVDTHLPGKDHSQVIETDVEVVQEITEMTDLAQETEMIDTTLETEEVEMTVTVMIIETMIIEITATVIEEIMVIIEIITLPGMIRAEIIIPHRMIIDHQIMVAGISPD